ncbi:MAG: arginase family protein [Lacisediminihabitans sp.]
MALTFIVVPQWQGSGSARAMRLVDGAEAIRGDLPAASTRLVDVPLEAGDEQGTGIARFSSIGIVRERLAATLNEIEGPAVVIGGDCAVTYASAQRSVDATTAVVWFDAHADLNTPASSPSSAYSGMVLRSLVDDGVVVPGRVILAGTRALDDQESDYLVSSDVTHVSVDDLAGDALESAIAASGATSVYLHIDVDVLDPGSFKCVSSPEPFGLEPARLVALIRALKSRWTLAGASITGFAPPSPEDAADDMPTILRVIGALSA